MPATYRPRVRGALRDASAEAGVVPGWAAVRDLQDRDPSQASAGRWTSACRFGTHITPSAGFQFMELPATRVVSLLHVGPYDTLGEGLRRRSRRYIAEHGLSVTAPPREFYLSQPDVPPEHDPDAGRVPHRLARQRQVSWRSWNWPKPRRPTKRPSRTTSSPRTNTRADDARRGACPRTACSRSCGAARAGVIVRRSCGSKSTMSASLPDLDRALASSARRGARAWSTAGRPCARC